MTGLLILALMTAGILALLWALRLRGPLLTLAAAAIAFGCAGYAMQGRPSLDGSARNTATRAPPVPLAKPRKALMGEFTAANSWLTISESYASRGKSLDSVGILRSAIRERPTDYALWVGLGNALSDHARTLTPAARFAYARAAQLAPGHPAPRFFLGLALARSGEPRQALAIWREILADAPADASWRPFVEDGVAALSGGAPPAAPPPQ